MPFKADDPRIARWCARSLDVLDDPTIRPHVEILDALQLLQDGPDTSPPPEWARDPRLGYRTGSCVDLPAWNARRRPRPLRLPPDLSDDYASFRHFAAPVIDCPAVLASMGEEVRSLGGDVRSGPRQRCGSVRAAADRAHALGCDTLVNCTGVGARSLAGDRAVVLGRGATLLYPRDGDGAAEYDDAVVITEEPPWGTARDPAYVIPRGDVYVVGGTYHLGEAGTDMTPAERRRIERTAARVLPKKVIAEGTAGRRRSWVGFRPVREGTVRCELDTENYGHENMRIVHNYGHGGSGWTIGFGSVHDVLQMLEVE